MKTSTHSLLLKITLAAVCLALSIPTFAARPKKKQQQEPPRPVVFDANFEQGALGDVELIDSARVVVRPGDTVEHLSYLLHGKFDPENPVDVTLKPSANWYYYRIAGVKGKQIYITTEDNGVHRTSFSYDGKKWGHLPENESEWGHIGKFFKKDTVYIALFIPYTYSDNVRRIAEWEKRDGVEVDTIGYSGQGRPMQMLHITDRSVPAANKARVWIHGRIHPSETPGSWLLDGFLEQLTGDSEESKSIRRQIDFYVLPFANPDGVANGLSRSNPTGVNQEINFDRSPDSTVVEVAAMKAAFERLTAEKPFDIMLNNHSQLSDFACYWMHRGDSSSMRYQQKLWAFAGLTCSFNPYMRPLDLSFSDIASRYAEGWFWNHFGDRTVALTLETPYNCFSFNPEDEWSTRENLAYFGRRLLQAIAEYLNVSTPGRVIVETPENPGDGWEVLGEGYSCLGENAWMAKVGGVSMTYKRDYLEEGVYDVYRFVPGLNIAPAKGSNFRTVPDKDGFVDPDPGVHGWKLISEYKQPRNGKFKYNVVAEGFGDVADAILLIKK